MLLPYSDLVLFLDGSASHDRVTCTNRVGYSFITVYEVLTSGIFPFLSTGRWNDCSHKKKHCQRQKCYNLHWCQTYSSWQSCFSLQLPGSDLPDKISQRNARADTYAKAASLLLQPLRICYSTHRIPGFSNTPSFASSFRVTEMQIFTMVCGGDLTTSPANQSIVSHVLWGWHRLYQKGGCLIKFNNIGSQRVDQPTHTVKC